MAVGGNPDAVAVNPVTNQVYVANSASASVSVINGATNNVTTTVSVKSNPVAGSHLITTVYGGDANHAGSTSSLTEIIDTLTLTPTTLPSAMVGKLCTKQSAPAEVTAPQLTPMR